MQNTILPDHHDKLAEQFNHINYLVDNQKFEHASELMIEMHYADLADYLNNINHRLYPKIFSLIQDKIAPETISCLSDANKQVAVNSLKKKVAVDFINRLDLEDSIEIIESLSDELKSSIILKLPPDKRQQIIEGFQYPEDTVGRVLEKDFVALKNHWTVGQAIDYIKRSNIKNDFHAAIIVNSKFNPVGTISLSTLLTNQRNTPITNLMNHDFKISSPSTELDELAFIFKQYALTVVPVTNKQGKLIGTVSIDNMIYIIDEQTENEFMYLGGINNGDIFHNLYSTTKSRFPWLFVNLVTACLTSLIINQFSDTIAKLVTLATIMPIVASMGGNAGTQAMTVTIRALAHRDINKANHFRIIIKEISVCTLNGFLLAIIGGILTHLLFYNDNLSLVFALAVIINFCLAGFLGAGIPLFLNHINIDPAAASGVFLTAFTDAIGFFCFLSLSYFLLV